MTEKTEEQMEKERAAVASMAKAQANMKDALDRIATLELALRRARSNLETLKGFIGETVYTYNGNDRKSCRSVADDAMSAITKVIGV